MVGGESKTSDGHVTRVPGSPGGGGARTDVEGPSPGELFSETNDNSVALLLTHGTARVLLAGDAEAREEEYMAFGPYTGPLTVLNVPILHTLSQGSAPCWSIAPPSG
jgi:beta-lactamase superfamily II metal-dependent hydrolase